MSVVFVDLVGVKIWVCTPFWMALKGTHRQTTFGVPFVKVSSMSFWESPTVAVVSMDATSELQL